MTAESGAGEKGSTKAWGGRFSTSPDARSEAFTASIGFDHRMIREDIRGSVAHVRMLGRQRIIDPAEAEAIERGLWRIWEEVEEGTFSYSISDEDVHTAVERRLRDLIGPVQGKLHTARSRNDQVVTDLRLWTKGAIVSLASGVIDLAQALLDRAAEHQDTIMPGYTHTQRAQPVLLAHHFLAYVAMLERDLDRLQEAYRRLDRLPLGSGALAGVTFPIDRESVAADLGFAGITTNSLDAVSDRDFVLDVLYACSLIALHISRLCEELVYWSTGEFRFVEFSDAFATGSSIMPQKKNPDVAELSRGKTGRVFGHLMGTLTVVKGLPLAYNSDLQEDKEALFDTVDTMLAVLGVVPPAIRTLHINRERMSEAAIADFSLATDAADLLARNGVPFREAHEIVGRLVRRCIEQGITFADLTDEEWAAVHPVFATQRPPLTARESVEARDVPGGTAPNRVAAAHAAARAAIERAQAWVAERRDALARVMSPPAASAGSEPAPEADTVETGRPSHG
ncbi:MAG TPA: argininosuccinate lyase [Thermomicrobiales bacterium]